MSTSLKSTLLISIMILSSLASFAQDTEEVVTKPKQSLYELRKGYTGNAEFILGCLEIGLNTTQGYRFNNHWSIGANTGVNISWTGPVVPLCAVGQFDINVGENTSLLVNAKAGGVFALTSDGDLKNRAGGNFAIGAGVRYRRMSFQLAYNLTTIPYYSGNDYVVSEGDELVFKNELLKGYATIQLRIGFNFGAR